MNPNPNELPDFLENDFFTDSDFCIIEDCDRIAAPLSELCDDHLEAEQAERRADWWEATPARRKALDDLCRNIVRNPIK